VLPLLLGKQRLQRVDNIEATVRLWHLLSTLQERCCHRHMQDSLPAGWLAFAGRELNPLDRDERFPSSTSLHWDRNRARPAVGEGFPFLLFRLQDGFTVPPWLTVIASRGSLRHLRHPYNLGFSSSRAK